MKNSVIKFEKYDNTDDVMDKLLKLRKGYSRKFYEYNTKKERTYLLKHYRIEVERFIRVMSRKALGYVFRGRININTINNFIGFIDDNVKQAYKENKIEEALFLSEYYDFFGTYVFLYEENKRRK